MKKIEMLIEKLDDLMHDLCNQSYNPEQWTHHDKIKALRRYDYQTRLADLQKEAEDLDECSEEEWSHFVDLFEEVSRLVKIY